MLYYRHSKVVLFMGSLGVAVQAAISERCESIRDSIDLSASEYEKAHVDHLHRMIS